MATTVRSEDSIRLNDKQQAVLRWVADGCPGAALEDNGRRISAAALRSRGLVQISGRGPAWGAVLTEAGRRYLDALDGRQLDTLDGRGVDTLDGRQLDTLDGRALAAMVEAAAPVNDRLHPVARGFRDRIERHEVSRRQLGRAVEIVQALVEAAEARGWTCDLAGESQNEVGLIDWASAKDGHFSVSADASRYWLRLQEEGVRTRGVLEDENAHDAFDADGTGRLKLELRWGDWFTRKQTRWSDRGDRHLEDQLVDVLREIEERAAESERVERERREREERAEADAAAEVAAREAEWERLMAVARERFVEDRRSAALLAQVEGFEQAARIRAYCDAVSAAVSVSAVASPDPEVLAWVEWARAHADRLDPLSEASRPGSDGSDGPDGPGGPGGPDGSDGSDGSGGSGVGPRAPAGLEPSPAALQEYLPEGWSASGPA